MYFINLFQTVNLYISQNILNRLNRLVCTFKTKFAKLFSILNNQNMFKNPKAQKVYKSNLALN